MNNKYPLVPVREGIVFPNTENVLTFGREKSVLAINKALASESRQVVLVMQRNSSEDSPTADTLHSVGTLATIKNVVNGEKGEINALVRGIDRVRIVNFDQVEPHFEAEAVVLQDIIEENDEIQAMVKHIAAQIKKAINYGKTIDFIFLMNILNVTSPSDFSNQVAMVLDLREYERQELLEEMNLVERLKREVLYTNRELRILEIEQNLSSKTQQKFEQGMKESFLREKMKTIEEELGGKGEDKDLAELRDKIKKAKMPKKVEEKAVKEASSDVSV